MPSYWHPLKTSTANITAYDNGPAHVQEHDGKCGEIQWQIIDNKGPAIHGLSSAETFSYVSLPKIRLFDLPDAPVELAAIFLISPISSSNESENSERLKP